MQLVQQKPRKISKFKGFLEQNYQIKKQPTQQKRKIKDKLQSRLNYENGPLGRQLFHFRPNPKVEKVSKLVFEHDFPSHRKSYQIESNSKTTRCLAKLCFVRLPGSKTAVVGH